MTMRPLSLLAAVAGTLLAQSADVSAILKRAVTEQESGDLRAAIRDYKEVLRARPHLTQARTNMAAALAQSGRMDEAVDAYRAALNERSSDLEIRTNLALALYTKGDSAAAAVEFQKVQESRATDEKVGALLAGCYVQLKDYEKALAALDRPVKAHPSSPDLLYLKGMALIRSGHPQDGVVFVERVAKTTGSADAFLLAGVTQMTMGQLGPARENLDEAVKRNPALPGALSWAGLARDRTGDEDGAKQAFQQALATDPNNFEANLHMGAILYRQHEYQAAKSYLERAQRTEPQAPMAQYATALITAALGDTSGAVSSLEAIVQRSPDWLEPRVKLSSLYYKLGREADGKREQAAVDQLNAEHRGKSSPFEN